MVEVVLCYIEAARCYFGTGEAISGWAKLLRENRENRATLGSDLARFRSSEMSVDYYRK